MPEVCTCGAQLPPDAVFCHKCGKPQREIVQVETQTPPAPPPPIPAMETPREFAPVSFRNMEVVKTALMAAVLATFLLFLPYVNWLAAGYFAVFFYRRRTHQPVGIVAGVRIGWLTGLMNFAILTIILVSWVLMLRNPEA
ncbi:MAG TPA: zinc ribbon domain-containing protein, partial [Bryobacteraceae bacterium]|nr:zinc ribbon domain-containing protein [Bryobacteraceae bacterium]